MQALSVVDGNVEHLRDQRPVHFLASSSDPAVVDILVHSIHSAYILVVLRHNVTCDFNENGETKNVTILHKISNKNLKRNIA